MPIHVAKTRALLINGTAIQDHCRSISVTDQADNIDVTTFAGAAYKQYASGLKDATVSADVFADFDAGQVHSILQPLYASGGTFTVKYYEDSTQAISATNPSLTMTGKLYEYSPVSGNVGEAAVFTATIRNAGTAGPVWGTT